MNERIRELAIEAGAGKWDDDLCLPMMDIEKFAQLIVRECCDWIDGAPTTEEGSVILTKQFIIANLKERFRIKS